MALKFHYDEEDDVFTLYEDKHPPIETIEFSEFLNIDIDKDRRVVGMEIFYAKEFLSRINKIVDEKLLNSIDKVTVKCDNFRNNWFITIILTNKGKDTEISMPTLRKNDYTSPLIASCE